MKTSQTIAIVWYGTICMVALVAFLVLLVTSPTPDNPTADAAGTHLREPVFPALLWVLLVVTALAAGGVFLTRKKEPQD